MSVIERDFVATPVSATLLGRSRSAIAWVLRVRKAMRNRRAFYRLGEMDDTMLADIGLTRADLHIAGALPFDHDPTIGLGTIAAARSRNMRRS